MKDQGAEALAVSLVQTSAARRGDARGDARGRINRRVDPKGGGSFSNTEFGSFSNTDVLDHFRTQSGSFSNTWGAILRQVGQLRLPLTA